ncbi:MAG: hypothetical protein IIB69_14360 [Proteobacteria bacterium]|nr:hypothetical protein [Pseudomonadota bacterium]
MNITQHFETTKPPLSRPQHYDHKQPPSPDDCRALWLELSDGLFHKARDLATPSRLIRRLCSHWPHLFLSTQAGYKRVDHASGPEIQNAINDLRSRARHINDRADGLEGGGAGDGLIRNFEMDL